MEGADILCVSCDWFSVSGHLTELGTIPFAPAGCVVQEMGRTAVWGRRYYLMSPEGVKMGTILCDPISPIIKSDRCVVEVSNQWLYRQDFHRTLDALEQVFPFVVDGVQRVDLCCDFEMSAGRWEVVKMLEDGRAYVKGLRRGVDWWMKDGACRKPHQLSWGGKDSVFSWKLYNKHKELWEGGTCSKPYIEDMWREMGMETTKVWRLEVSLTSIKRLESVFKPVVFYREWYDNAAPYFRDIYADKFVIRENQGHKDKRCDDLLRFLDFYGSKVFRHKKPKDSEVENDCERRVVCKAWKEFTDAEVRCNQFLIDGLRELLVYLFQRVSNVNAVCRRFKITEREVMNLLSC